MCGLLVYNVFRYFLLFLDIKKLFTG